MAVPTSESTSIVVNAIDESSYEVSYLDRSDAVPDTATVGQLQLTLRYRNILAGQVQGVDVLTFVPQDAVLPTSCSFCALNHFGRRARPSPAYRCDLMT